MKFNGSCPIWGRGFPANVHQSQKPFVNHVDSPRAGGPYRIDDITTIKVSELSLEEKSRLTTWLIDQRTRGGNRHPLVTEEIITFAKNRRPLEVYERADRLLSFLVLARNAVSEIIRISPVTDDNPNLTESLIECCHALAWSESQTFNDLFYFLDYLQKQNWINRIGANGYTVTVHGHNQVAEQKASINSSQAFVAMWFNESMDKAFKEGIGPAVMEAGYIPLRIDNKKDVNKLDDEIIAAIRESLFVIADFTHGKEGLRGSVYYEAGFAHGLGKTVIFTCQEDTIRKLHFDVRQYAFIGWKTPEDLRKGLLDRIRARVGTGLVSSDNIE